MAAARRAVAKGGAAKYRKPFALASLRRLGSYASTGYFQEGFEREAGLGRRGECVTRRGGGCRPLGSKPANLFADDCLC